jgi:hypothetical protein
LLREAANPKRPTWTLHLAQGSAGCCGRLGTVGHDILSSATVQIIVDFSDNGKSFLGS